VIRNTDNVKGFVGTYSKGQKPTPLTNDEVEKIFLKMKEFSYDIKVGDTIKIVDHELLEGVVTEVIAVDYNLKEVKINAQIIGEQREIIVPFAQFEHNIK